MPELHTPIQPISVEGASLIAACAQVDPIKLLGFLDRDGNTAVVGDRQGGLFLWKLRVEKAKVAKVLKLASPVVCLTASPALGSEVCTLLFPGNTRNVLLFLDCCFVGNFGRPS